MLFIFLVIILNFIQLLSQKCKSLQLEDEEIFYTAINQPFMIEQDDEKEDQVEYRINQKIIEKSFQISLYNQGQVIQSKVIEPLNSKIKFEKWICNLMKSSTYFITYTSFLGLTKNTIDSYQNQIIEINSKSDEICEEFFGNQNNLFIVFCYTFKYLNIYSVSIQDNQTQLLQQFDFSNLNITSCQRFYQDLQDFQFVFAFFQCENWNIIYFNNNSSQILLNQTILQQINMTSQIKQLKDIQICSFSNQFFITLIENDFYVLFNSKRQEIKSQIFVQSKIKKIVFNQNCYQILSITESNTGQILIKNIQFFINFNSSFEMNYVNNHLFFQNENQISILFTPLINYTIQIANKKIKFIQKLNYFYQIDEESRQIQFYQYNEILQFIKPQKQFLFVFEIQESIFSIRFLLCYKIIRTKQEQERKCQILASASNQCQPQSFVNIQHFMKYNNTFYELQIPKLLQQNSYNQNIFDELQKCTPHFNKLNQILLTYSNTSVLYLKNDILRYFSCKNECQNLSIKVNGIEIYQKQDIFFLFKKGVDQVKVLEIDSQGCLIIQKYQLQYTPDKIQQFDKIFIIKSKDKLPIIINIIPHIALLNQYQLIEELFLNEEIEYFKNTKKKTYIQYQDFLLLQQEQQLNYIKIKDIQIIQILPFNLGAQVFGVHRSQSMLIYFYINNYQIYHSKNITFENFNLIRPLVYQFHYNKVLLSASKFDQIYLLILFFQNQHQIYWIKSIKINNLYFFIKDQYLIYQDENNQIKQINIDTLTIEINNLNSTQSTILVNQNYLIQLVSQFDNKTVECQLQIDIYNQCNLLQINSYYEKQLLSNMITLSNYFYGPIFQLYIKNNPNLKLKGPLIESQQLQECKMKSDIFCIFKTKLENNLKDIECYNIVLHNNIQFITGFGFGFGVGFGKAYITVGAPHFVSPNMPLLFLKAYETFLPLFSLCFY